MHTAKAASKQPQRSKSGHAPQENAGKRAEGRKQPQEKEAPSKAKETQPKANHEKTRQVSAQELPGSIFPELPKWDEPKGESSLSLGEVNGLKAELDTKQAIMQTLQNASRKNLEENPEDLKAKQNTNLSGNLSSWFGNGSKILEQHGHEILKDVEKQIQNGNEPDLSMLEKDEQGFGDNLFPPTDSLNPFDPSLPSNPFDPLGPLGPLFPPEGPPPLFEFPKPKEEPLDAV